ncbi:MAG: hypothetical protein V1709_10315 [Planctomycetota bacterium]
MNWLKKLYEKLAFQSRYDKIKLWKLPDDVEKLFDETWDNLPKNIQKALWELIKRLYDRYGEEFAIIILQKLLGSLKTQVFARG